MRVTAKTFRVQECKVPSFQPTLPKIWGARRVGQVSDSLQPSPVLVEVASNGRGYGGCHGAANWSVLRSFHQRLGFQSASATNVLPGLCYFRQFSPNSRANDMRRRGNASRQSADDWMRAVSVEWTWSLIRRTAAAKSPGQRPSREIEEDLRWEKGRTSNRQSEVKRQDATKLSEWGRSSALCRSSVSSTV